MHEAHEHIPTLRRVHVHLPERMPTDAIQAELGASTAAVVRAALEALAEVHHRSPRRARTLIARNEVPFGPKPACRGVR